MILRNWYNYLKAMQTGTLLPIKKVDGTTITCYGWKGCSYGRGKLYSSMNTVTVDTYTDGICLGTGTIPVTIDDYVLSGAFITNLTSSVVRETGTDEEGNCFVQATITATNTTTADITIGEVACLNNLECYTSSGANYTTNSYCLIDRTLLDAPITIPAGGIGQIVYRIAVAPMIAEVIP